MTSWGCTPTCRGFDHFYGFYVRSLSSHTSLLSHAGAKPAGRLIDVAVACCSWCSQNAFNDYFTHHVGPGLDFRDDLLPVQNETGHYFTEIVTANAIAWLEGAIAENATRSTFAYLAHESNHAPMQARPSTSFASSGHPLRLLAKCRCCRYLLHGSLKAASQSLSQIRHAACSAE